MFVRALRKGYFKTYREPGERFEIPDHLFSDLWHEEVLSNDEDDAGFKKAVPAEKSLEKRDKARAGMAEYKPKDPQRDLLAKLAKLTPAERLALLGAAEKVAKETAAPK